MIGSHAHAVTEKLRLHDHEGYLLVPQKEPKPNTDKCMIANPILGRADTKHSQMNVSKLRTSEKSPTESFSKPSKVSRTSKLSTGNGAYATK
jgi:hypothetical protein